MLNRKQFTLYFDEEEVKDIKKFCAIYSDVNGKPLSYNRFFYLTVSEYIRNHQHDITNKEVSNNGTGHPRESEEQLF